MAVTSRNLYYVNHELVQDDATVDHLLAAVNWCFVSWNEIRTRATWFAKDFGNALRMI
jgi:hypothetical protein